MRLALHIAAAVLIGVAFPAFGEDWSFGSFQLNGFEGFSEQTRKEPRQLDHPNGTEVLVSVYRASAEAEAQMFGGDPEKRLAMHEQGAQRVYQRSAQRNEPSIPLSREALRDGSTLISGALKKSGLFQSGYFLIYMVVAPSERVALVTVEGKGDPKEEYKRYRTIFETVKWLQ